MPYVGLAFFILVGIAMSRAKEIAYWWRKGCDACRLHNIGGATWTATPHTCFWHRNKLYKDRNGQVWEFGRKIEPRA